MKKRSSVHLFSLKSFLRMRITVMTLLLSVPFFQIQARSYAQSKKISLDMEDVTLAQVIHKIESSSDFKFLLNRKDIDLVRKVSIRVKRRPIKDVLSILFSGTDEGFEILKKQIILRRKTVEKNTATLYEVQKITVEGTVIDENDQPLPGVTVIEKGTKNGTITGIDGKFSLGVSEKDAVLVFSFIGHKTQEAPMKKDMKVQMKVQETRLKDVVVVGYGTSTRKALTNAVGEVKTEQMAEAPFTSVVAGISGRVAGVSIGQSGGSYASTPSISIRGGEDPLYVVDGTIVDARTFMAIAPEDIESINFLKDYASAAVYGFNSDSGVVQVVTKKGVGKMKVTFSSDMSWQYVTIPPKYFTDPEQRLDYRRKAYDNDAVSKATLTEPGYYNRGVDEPLFAVFRKFTPQERHVLTLSGSNKEQTTSNNLSVSRFSQDGAFRLGTRWGTVRYTVVERMNHKFKEIGLDIGATVNLQRIETYQPPQGMNTIFSHVRHLVAGPPYIEGTDKYNGRENSLAATDDRAGYNKYLYHQAFVQLNMRWRIPRVEGLSAYMMGSYRYNNVSNKNWSVSDGRAPVYNGDTPDPVKSSKPSLTQSSSDYEKTGFQAHLDYDKKFGKHDIQAKVMYIFEESMGSGFSAHRQNFPSSKFPFLDFGAQDDKLANSGGAASQFAREGYLGQLKYNFGDRYIAQVTGRYDGYYGFAPGHKYGFFPSASLGWNVDKEPFFKPILIKAKISALKIRASSGAAGKTAGNFAYLSTYSSSPTSYYQNGAYNFGAWENNIPPPVGSIPSWYTTIDQDIAVDIAFLDDKFTLSWDWYRYTTTGYIQAPANVYATPLGLALPRVNNDDAKRKRGGMDFTVKYKETFGDFHFEATGTLGFHNSYWTRHVNDNAGNAANPRTSRSNSFENYSGVALQDMGLYQTIDDVLNSPRYRGATRTTPGEIKYKDVNGDGQIDDNDHVKIGKVPSRLNFGLNLSGSYKGLTLNVLFEGKTGRYTSFGWVATRRDSPVPTYEYQLDTWTPSNTGARFPRSSYYSLTNLNGKNNNQSSSYWYINSSYVRLRSVSLSYDLRKSLPKYLDVFQQFRLILSGTNLLTFSETVKYRTDPEGGDTDLFIYPNVSAVNLGLRVSF